MQRIGYHRTRMSGRVERGSTRRPGEACARLWWYSIMLCSDGEVSLVVGPGARRLETRRAAACLPSPAAWPAGLPAHGLDTRICIPRDWCEAQSLVRPLPAWYVTSQQAGAPHSTARRAGVALGARRVTAPGHRALGGALQLALVASALRPEPGSLGSHSEG
jgi:hypothetical protein